MTKSRVVRNVTMAVVATVVALTASGTPAQAHQLQVTPAPVLASQTDAPAEPAPKPAGLDTSRNTLPAKSCGSVADGKTACVEVLDTAGEKLSLDTGPSTNSILPLPEFCYEHAFDGLWGDRTHACEIYRIFYTTYVIVDGVPRIDGDALLDVINYTYTDENGGVFAHQVEVALIQGWGEALKANVQGTATSNAGCTTNFSTFPSQPIVPVGARRGGEAQFNTMAFLPGDIATCKTTWSIKFINPGYPWPDEKVVMDEVRCDNVIVALGFRPARVGCVIPWYAAAVTYRYSVHPTLAAHVVQAIASGLPGSTFADPLVKTSDPAIVNANRNLACGDSPSIDGMECDEYPLASTLQGLASGGTRRTFPGCNIAAPSGTGPIGASACMINATDNHSQGGTMSNFYYDRRVLDGDSYRVAVAP
jgi:hypothetical protein